MTPQHHIIKETSETISRLLQAEFREAGYKRVQIIEEAPKPDSIEGKLPAVSVYLYQVSLDAAGGEGNIVDEIFSETNEDGEEVEYRRKRRLFVRLDYLVSSWAQTPEDEQILMGLVVRALIDNRSIDAEKVYGDSFEESKSRDDLFMAMTTRLDEGTLARFWGSLSQPVRPAISMWTAVPILPKKKHRITRVAERELAFRDLNSPPSGPKSTRTPEKLSREQYESE